MDIKTQAWPVLDFEQFKDTLATVHLWTQIVGKIRLSQSPWINHSWHATFYVAPRGLTSSLIPVVSHLQMVRKLIYRRRRYVDMGLLPDQ